MTKRCKGCGVVLQNTDKTQVGYTPKDDADVCQRCFRITHYDDVVISMKQGVDPDEILAKIAMMDALVLWVVDVFDFEADMIQGMNRHLIGKDIVMVATKRDLLPQTLGDEKLSKFILSRLKALGITIAGMVICGDLVHHAYHEYNDSIPEILQAISYYRKGRDVVVMGMANAGKSTLLNALCHESLTTSRHPGTTLDFNAIQMDGYTLYDTPGLTRMDSLLTHVPDALLKSVIPDRALKQRNYQLYEDQTLSLGGLVRLDLIGCEDVSCVAYFSQRLHIHRSKQGKADQLWQDHMHGLLSPAIDESLASMKRYELSNIKTKTDVVIHGLGWFCIQGSVKQIYVYVSANANVTFRKAMI